MAARPIDAPLTSARERFLLPENEKVIPKVQQMEQRMSGNKRLELVEQKEREVTTKMKKNLNVAGSDFSQFDNQVMSFQDWLQDIWNSADDFINFDFREQDWFERREKLKPRRKKDQAPKENAKTQATESCQDDIFKSFTGCLMIDSMDE